MTNYQIKYIENGTIGYDFYKSAKIGEKVAEEMQKRWDFFSSARGTNKKIVSVIAQ